MIYNLTVPVTAAMFERIPHQRSKWSKANDEGIEQGTSDVLSGLSGLSPAEARKKLLKMCREMKKSRDRHDKDLKQLDAEYNHLSGLTIAYEELNEWVKGFLKFESPNGNAFGEFRSSIENEEIYDINNFKIRPSIEEYQKEIFDDASIFLIEHNWFGAINKADEFSSGSFRLPYDTCIFEFMVSRKPVIGIFTNYSSDGVENEIVMQIAVRSLAGWMLSPNIYRHSGGSWDIYNGNHAWTCDSLYLRLVRLIGEQVRAACIALDAEVATSNLIRAPHIGHEKEAETNYPEYEYYTISLANRQKAEDLRSSDEIKGVKRLHFRRGHWRHFISSKTWVRWCLVGNPELGFIDKQYRL